MPVLAGNGCGGEGGGNGGAENEVGVPPLWPLPPSALPMTVLLLPLLPLPMLLLLLLLLFSPSGLPVQKSSARYFSASRLSSWWLGDRAKPSLHSRRALW